MKRGLIITGCIIAVILIIAGLDYFVLSKTSPPEPAASFQEVELPSSPEEVELPTEMPSPLAPVQAPAEPPAPSFEQKIEVLKQAIARVRDTGESQEITVVFTEAETNEQAAKQLTATEIPEDIPVEIKGFYIDLQTGNNVFTVIEAVIYGFTGTIEIKSQVGVEAGRPSIAVTDVGVPPLPGLKDKVAGFAQQKIEDLIFQLIEAELGSNEEVDLEYKEIKTQEEDITITLLIKPKA